MDNYIAKKPFNGTGNQTVTPSKVMNSLVISNESGADLTFTLNGETYTINTGYTFDEIVEPFSSVAITATGKYFGFCRRRIDETR